MDNKKLINLLSLFAVFLVIPLMLGVFFDGYTVVSKGVKTTAPVEFSLFEFLNQRSVLLVFAFLFAVVLILCILANIVYTIKITLAKVNGGILRFYFAVIIMISAVLTFMFTLIYCLKNSTSGTDAALTYKVGGCEILMLVCGLVIGGLNLICYILSTKKNKVKK